MGKAVNPVNESAAATSVLVPVQPNTASVTLPSRRVGYRSGGDTRRRSDRFTWPRLSTVPIYDPAQCATSPAVHVPGGI